MTAPRSTLPLLVTALALPLPCDARRHDVTALKKLSIEELMEVHVVTPSRVHEPADRAPGSVYVYPRELIKSRGYRSLGELLQTVPGFTVFQRDLQSVTSVRGLAANDNDKVTLLINGQNLNGPHEQDYLDGPINLDDVERVEVVVGPSSLLQPANTLAATVNVITREVEGVETQLSAGSALRYAATLEAGRRRGDRYAGFSFTLEEKRGFDAWRPGLRSNLVGRETTGALESPSYFGVARLRAGEWSGQAVAYRAAWPELNIQSAVPGGDGVMVEEKYSAFVARERPLAADLTGVFRADASVKEQTRMGRDGFPAFAVQQSVKQRAYAGELGLRHSGFTGHFIQAGAQAGYVENVDVSFSYGSPAQPAGTGASDFYPRTTLVDRDTRSLGFYAEDAFDATERLRLIAGARVDENTVLEGGRWFPGGRAALVLEPVDAWTTKALYNRAVRIPSILEAANTVWGRDRPASPFFARKSLPASDPEILTTYEWQNILYAGTARVSLSLYHQELSGFITWFEPHANGGDFSGDGAELALQAALAAPLDLWGNVSWNDSKLSLSSDVLFGAASAGAERHHAYVDGSGRIIGAARYTANAGADWRVSPRLTLSPALRWFSYQAALDFSADAYRHVNDRVYLDAGAAWRRLWSGDLDVYLAGRNLLDDRRPVGAQLTGDLYRPRGIHASLTAALRLSGGGG